MTVASLNQQHWKWTKRPWIKKRTVEFHVKGLCGCWKRVWMLKEGCTSRYKKIICKLLKSQNYMHRMKPLSWNSQRPEKQSGKGPCIRLLFPEVGG